MLCTAEGAIMRYVKFWLNVPGNHLCTVKEVSGSALMYIDSRTKRLYAKNGRLSETLSCSSSFAFFYLASSVIRLALDLSSIYGPLTIGALALHGIVLCASRKT